MIAMILPFLAALPAWAADQALAVAPHVSAIPDWVHWLTGVIVLPFIWPFIKKMITGKIVQEFVLLIRLGIEAGDDDDDIFINAFVTWVNAKCSKLGTSGPARFKVWAADICTRVGFLKGREDIVAELAEDIVEGVGAEAALLGKTPPAAPPSPQQ